MAESLPIPSRNHDIACLEPQAVARCPTLHQRPAFFTGGGSEVWPAVHRPERPAYPKRYSNLLLP